MTHDLSSYLYADEAQCVEELLASRKWDGVVTARTKKKAKDLVEKIRTEKRKPGELESFLQQYSLTTDEGLSLMCLAEALLRIPDAQTASALIKDKVAAANWLSTVGSSKDWVVKAAGVGLFVTSKTLDGVLSRMGEPIIREAMIKAMRLLGKQFVLGETIEEAEQNAQVYRDKGYRMSYDMLGEGARTAVDAQHYFESYHHAIGYIGERRARDKARKPGISVKLSALHPRYEYAQAEHCLPEMIHTVKKLALHAASHQIAFMIDAEESERLDISVQIAESVLSDPMFEHWEDFGMAVQAYQKRAYPLIGHLAELTKTHKSRMQIRLVKGAYWDSEIKRAQVLGLSDYPVFTRKSNTDLSFQACAALLFENSGRFYPMIGTHNAQSAAAVLKLAEDKNIFFELQRLYGMGESLFDVVQREEQSAMSVYAPVGNHHDLLPYLVRRLLENGANSSFVNKLLDPKEPMENMTRDPVVAARENEDKRHPLIPLPKDIYKEDVYGEGRRNSEGLDLDDGATTEPLLKTINKAKFLNEAAPLIGGKLHKDTIVEDVTNPATGEKIGEAWPANDGLVEQAFEIAGKAFESWSKTPAETRAQALEKFAELLEKNRDELIGLCVHEAGKTIPDAVAEIREAVDFCLYYAERGRKDFDEKGTRLQGPTGERNILTMHGRGVFVCISPWNFPLAIFTGQIVAALMAGNTVIAKPAEQTPLIAMKAVELMHKAGIPAGAINLLPGGGRIGASIVQHESVAGVAFTGSTDIARAINLSLAKRKGAIVPLIAETGGQNAMIVDSSALPEQVVDDVITSAFGAAGQRCSALRVLFLQDEIADKIIRMLEGAMATLRIGNPADISTDIGPVIDSQAHDVLKKHRKKLEGFGKKIYEVDLGKDITKKGHFFAPCAFQLENMEGLTKEVFGPILHIICYKADKLDDIIEDINATGYGLTLGVHSRIDTTQQHITNAARVGNAYVNRSMIGATVGVQPFGGQGLSGTGPKAGGPHYLQRFATEKVVSTDTTAQGGNASLVSLEE
ncbi:MAG: bifunctional protein PutA [Micavibrio sp.]|nr:MAG: bifunctional protein PutA [Micavibrio sp.]